MIINKSALRIDIRGDGTQLTVIRKDGTKESKTVDLSELTNTLASSVENDLGMLPRGIRHFSQKGNNILVVIEVPSGVHELNYSRSGDTKECHLPAALFFIKLFKKNDGRLSVGDTWIFAMKRDFISLKTDPLFHYPAPNVYPDNHKICWGGAMSNFGAIKSLAALTSLAQSYFSAPFNNDLFRAGDLSNYFPWAEVSKVGTLVEEYFSFIKDHAFENIWLKPAKEQYSNYNKALQYIKNRGNE